MTHFFTGFPSYWNIVALYLFAARLPRPVNAAILLVLSVLVFVRIGYVYPYPHADAARRDHRPRRRLDGAGGGDRLDAAGGAAVAPARVARSSRSTTRCCRWSFIAAAAGADRMAFKLLWSRRLRDRVFGRHLRRARHHDRGGDDLGVQAGLRRAPADARRRGHLVPLRRRHAAGSGWTNTIRTCRSREIPVHLQHAFIAVEDHRFYSHPGVDPIALGRAVVRNVRASGTVEGGSTLTQQLARTLFLSNQRPTDARPAKRCSP